MKTENSARNPGFPPQQPISGQPFCTAVPQRDDTEPPFWDRRPDANGRAAMAAAEEAIHQPSDPSDEDLVSDLLRDFASWVLDLPASENHHHANPKGLFRHSLEVATFAVQDLEERWSRDPERPGLAPEEQAHWLKVAFALGLFHDCGKVLEFDVRFSGTGPLWDPLQESLEGFRTRHGVAPLDPTPYRFRPRRGVGIHEKKGFPLLRTILAGRRWDRFRPHLEGAYLAFAFRRDVPIHSFAVPLAYLADRVHVADRRSAGRHRKKAQA